jgi:hypothetical protein
MKTQTFKDGLRWAALSLVFVSANGYAQVKVLKNGASVPENRINAIYATTFRVVAQEFHLPDSSSLRFPVTLVLGDRNERVVGDEVNKVYLIYMERWDEAKFALATSRIAVQHLVSEDRKSKIVSEILRRANRIAPVPLQALHSPSVKPEANEQLFSPTQP